jgi:WD40 repeat protein
VSCGFQVATGSLLKKWRAHYRAVTCLVFTEDDSLLVSGSEDGSVRVWPLLMYALLVFYVNAYLMLPIIEYN